jgi:glutaredoxin
MLTEIETLLGANTLNDSQAVSLPKVTLYSKAGCHLCDEARDMLDEIATQVPYDLTEIDIRKDPQIFELYRYRIPVILLNETVIAEGRIDYNSLASVFDAS